MKQRKEVMLTVCCGCQDRGALGCYDSRREEEKKILYCESCGVMHCPTTNSPDSYGLCPKCHQGLLQKIKELALAEKNKKK